MIEVLFGESEAGIMKSIKNYDDHTNREGMSNQVICLGFMLDKGYIKKPVSSQYRYEFIHSMYFQNQWEYGKDNGLEEEFKVLGNVYLKELYMMFIQQDDKDTIETFLELIISNYKLSTIVGFQKLGNTLKFWKKEIINSFHTYDGRKLSNGPIEGRNRTVKVILRLANGYTNFDRFRNRVLYVLNKYETYSEKILDVHKIRKTGIPKKKIK